MLLFCAGFSLLKVLTVAWEGRNMNEAPWGGGIVSSCGPVGDLSIEAGIAKTALEARMSAFGTRLCKVMGYEDLPSSERLRLMSEGERVEPKKAGAKKPLARGEAMAMCLREVYTGGKISAPLLKVADLSSNVLQKMVKQWLCV